MISKSVKNYTYTSVNECKDKVCNMVIYSGVRYGFENKTWKPIEDLQSFINTTPIGYTVDSDGMNIVEVLDYNMTSIKVKLKLSSTSDKKGVDNPIKVYEIKGINETTGKEIKDVKAGGLIKLANDKSEDIEILPFGQNYELHWGENSTTVKFNVSLDGTGGWLGSSVVSWATVWGLTSANGGTSSTCSVYNKYSTTPTWYIYRVAIPFNTSSIPDGATINSAQWAFYTTTVIDQQDDGLDYVALQSPSLQSNYTSRISGDFDLFKSANNTVSSKLDLTGVNTDTWYNLTITNLSIINTTGVTGLVVRGGHDIGAITIHDLNARTNQLTFTCRGTTNNTNYINITYTEASADATVPVVWNTAPANATYNQTWNVLNCTAYDETKLSNITFYINNTANITNSTPPSNNTNTWTNVSFTTNANYTWKCRACDNSSNCANSTQWQFVINYSTTATNSCTYSGTGNWSINASDHCNITATNLYLNQVKLNGSTPFECCTRGLINITNASYGFIGNANIVS